ncbi:helix-turn-helix transcriptional regulator, partial [Kitasatospora indigofera]|uniref:helix-turn-helix transcriptional regulator n=1 Tax=Kitasatospora indigofera TaxID=67307 RepID=UPI003676CC0D
GDAGKWLRAHRGFPTSGSWTDRLIAVPAQIAQVHRALDALEIDVAAAALESIGDASQSIEMWAFVADAAARHALLVGEPIVMLARLEHVARVHAEVHRGDGGARSLLERASIELLLSMGELNRAEQRIAESERCGDPLIVQAARLRLIAGSDDAAQKFAASAVWATETTVRDRAELLLIGAVAEMRLGDSEAAAQSFRRAHALAAHADTLTPYLGIAREELGALLELAGIQLPPGAHERLGTFRSVFPRSAQLISLTEREQVVLAQLVHTDAFSEVAAALTVSVNTVKKQAASAYAKLGVHDRRAALARAHQLGLLATEHQR